MPEPNQAGQAQVNPYPMPQDATDNTPVVNIPPSAVPPGMATAPHPHDQQLTRLMVNGQEQMVDQAKLVELAQKGVSSDSRYQEAAAMSKEAEGAIAWKADMELLAETGDIGAFRRAGAAIGLTGDEVEEAARITYEQVGEGNPEPQLSPDNRNQPQQEGNPGMSQQIAALSAQLEKIQGQMSGTTGYGNLSEDLQTLMVDAEQTRVNKIIQNALDLDPVLAYNMTSRDAKGQQAIRNMIDEKIRGRLDASDDKFGDGARILREVMPEVKETLEALGTPDRSIPQMGLGPSPGGQGADIYPTKEPDHVPSTEAGFEEHIQQLLQHNQYKAKQAGQ